MCYLFVFFNVLTYLAYFKVVKIKFEVLRQTVPDQTIFTARKWLISHTN